MFLVAPRWNRTRRCLVLLISLLGMDDIPLVPNVTALNNAMRYSSPHRPPTFLIQVVMSLLRCIPSTQGNRNDKLFSPVVSLLLVLCTLCLISITLGCIFAVQTPTTILQMNFNEVLVNTLRASFVDLVRIGVLTEATNR